jgi:hypothetical protein
VIKSRQERWIGIVACRGEMEMHTEVRLDKLMGEEHSEEVGIDGKIILD